MPGGDYDYNRITSKLWMGSAPHPNDLDHWRNRFRTIVLCAEEYQPGDGAFPGVEVLRCPIDDGDPTENERLLALRMGARVARRVRRGERVLVTCLAGRNRSGLVVGIALQLLGVPAKRCVETVRRGRGRDALSNPYFCAMLRSLNLPSESQGLPATFLGGGQGRYLSSVRSSPRSPRR